MAEARRRFARAFRAELGGSGGKRLLSIPSSLRARQMRAFCRRPALSGRSTARPAPSRRPHAVAAGAGPPSIDRAAEPGRLQHRAGVQRHDPPRSAPVGLFGRGPGRHRHDCQQCEHGDAADVAVGSRRCLLVSDGLWRGDNEFASALSQAEAAAGGDHEQGEQQLSEQRQRRHGSYASDFRGR